MPERKRIPKRACKMPDFMGKDLAIKNISLIVLII